MLLLLWLHKTKLKSHANIWKEIPLVHSGGVETPFNSNLGAALSVLRASACSCSWQSICNCSRVLRTFVTGSHHYHQLVQLQLRIDWMSWLAVWFLEQHIHNMHSNCQPSVNARPPHGNHLRHSKHGSAHDFGAVALCIFRIFQRGCFFFGGVDWGVEKKHKERIRQGELRCIQHLQTKLSVYSNGFSGDVPSFSLC